MQDRLFALNHQRMPRIVTTLKARNDCRLLCEQIDYLTLALVTPLRS